VFRAIRRPGGGAGPDRAAETARLGRGVAGSGSTERCGSTGPCRRRSGRRAGLAGADQCGAARGGGASGVTLAGVEDGEDLDRLGDAVDEDIVGMDHRLAGAGDAAGAVEIRVLDDPARGVTYCHTQSPRSIGMSVSNIGRDIVQRPTCRWPPDQREISDARRGR
jgi:hypothetical protein